MADVGSVIVTVLDITCSVLELNSDILRIVNLVNSEADRILSSLRAELHGVLRDEVLELQPALRNLRSAGETVKNDSNTINRKWQLLRAKLQGLRSSSHTVTKQQLQNIIDHLRDLLNKTGSSYQNFQVFQDRVNEALRIALRLEGQCIESQQKAKANAKKFFGLGVGGGMAGIAAAVGLGVAAAATGGIALPIAAGVVGVGAVAAAGIGAKKAHEFSKIGDQFSIVKSRLQDVITEIGKIDDSIQYTYQLTETAIRQIEDLLTELEIESYSDYSYHSALHWLR